MRLNKNSGEISQAILLILVIYGTISFIILPVALKKKVTHKEYKSLPKITFTKHGIPGDPINIGLVGTKDQVVEALILSGWYPADALTIRSVLKSSKNIMLGRKYLTAPVSNLYVWGRKQDLAFQYPAWKSPKKRHHVRFWDTNEISEDGRPFWIGAATFDRSIGFSRYTYQITHKIDADVDAERDALINDMKNAGVIADLYEITGVGPLWNGKNGGGDPYFTDGDVRIAIIKTELKTD